MNEIRNITVLNASQSDQGSGAGRAAERIHSCFSKLGFHSYLFTSKSLEESKYSFFNAVHRFINRLLEFVEARSNAYITKSGLGFSTFLSFGRFDIDKAARGVGAQIVVLYWINGGFLKLSSLKKLEVPIVWRLSDVWPLTGGCHYSGSCNGFSSDCADCPILKTGLKNRLANKRLLDKSKEFPIENITFVAPSHWMANMVRDSKYFNRCRVEVIHTGVNVDIFQPDEEYITRESLGLPNNKKIVLFGALSPSSDLRKGFRELFDALTILSSDYDTSNLLFVAFGGDIDIEIPTKLDFFHAGRFTSDEKLAKLYSASDLLVVPSLEDNLPNVAIEAAASGTAIVGFNTGGMPDVVKEGINGSLVPLGDSSALAQVIFKIADNKNLAAKMGQSSRELAVSRFDNDKQILVYAELIEDIIKSRSNT